MSDDVWHDGVCRICHTLCSRRPGGRWYNTYGRDECRLAPLDGLPHIVPEWTVRTKAETERLVNGGCGYGVVPEEWHHGVAGPPMTDAPADRCER